MKDAYRRIDRWGHEHLPTVPTILAVGVAHTGGLVFLIVLLASLGVEPVLWQRVLVSVLVVASYLWWVWRLRPKDGVRKRQVGR